MSKQTKNARNIFRPVVRFTHEQMQKQSACAAIRAAAKKFPKVRRVDLIDVLTRDLGLNPGTVRTQIQQARGE